MIAAKTPKERQKKVTARTQIATKNSEVSFVGDTDEDIDTTEIEEENWIEYVKRSTRLKDEASQYPMLDRDTLKDEMEIGNEDHFTPRDKMDKKKQQN